MEVSRVIDASAPAGAKARPAGLTAPTPPSGGLPAASGPTMAGLDGEEPTRPGGILGVTPARTEGRAEPVAGRGAPADGTGVAGVPGPARGVAEPVDPEPRDPTASRDGAGKVIPFRRRDGVDGAAVVGPAGVLLEVDDLLETETATGARPLPPLPVPPAHGEGSSAGDSRVRPGSHGGLPPPAPRRPGVAAHGADTDVTSMPDFAPIETEGGAPPSSREPSSPWSPPPSSRRRGDSSDEPWHQEFFSTGDAGIYAGGPGSVPPASEDLGDDARAARLWRTPEQDARRMRNIRWVVAVVGFALAVPVYLLLSPLLWRALGRTGASAAPPAELPATSSTAPLPSAALEPPPTLAPPITSASMTVAPAPVAAADVTSPPAPSAPAAVAPPVAPPRVEVPPRVAAPVVPAPPRRVPAASPPPPPASPPAGEEPPTASFDPI